MQYVQVSLLNHLCSWAVDALLLTERPLSPEHFEERLTERLGVNPCLVVEQDQKDADEPTRLFRHLPIRDGIVCKE